MKQIDQVHHDGLGLNDRITIEVDARDGNAGGASHRYVATMDISPDVVGEEGGPQSSDIIVLDIQFQHGPRHEPDSVPGVTEAAVLAVLIDRMRGFQAGPFACRENALALTHLEDALHWVQHRARDRARRGVLGTSQK